MSARKNSRQTAALIIDKPRRFWRGLSMVWNSLWKKADEVVRYGGFWGVDRTGERPDHTVGLSKSTRTSIFSAISVIDRQKLFKGPDPVR